MEMIVHLSGLIFLSVPMQIFTLSLCIFFVTLPMYRRSEQIQAAQQTQLKQMEHWISHIRRTFRGEERTMMLSAYYRQNDYRPVYMIRSILPLLLQIPFFMAAYHFLSTWDQLEGISFLWISDLGAPDVVTGIENLHLLPVLMTLCNILSGIFYTRGHSITEKVQVFGLAVLFLIVLYESPAGLVLYWTMNNLLSMLLHLIEKCKERQRLTAWIFFLADIAFIHQLLERGTLLGFFESKEYLLSAICLVVIALLFIPMIRHFCKRKESDRPADTDTGSGWRCILVSESLLTLLIGAVIPAAAIASSPLDFVNTFHYYDPLYYILRNTLTAAGLFLGWGSIFYFFLFADGRKLYEKLISAISICSVADYFFFTGMEGIVSENLIFDHTPVYANGDTAANSVVLLLLCLCAAFIKTRGKMLLRYMQTVMVVVSAVFIAAYTIRTASALQKLPSDVKSVSGDTLHILPFSTEGKNVVIIMMDRAISAYIPYIFQEKPELHEQFDGFVWYPNAVSFGGSTIFGMPAVFGGYEYNPHAINARSNVTVADKINEALCVMPVLFGENGYEVTVCDPPYAGFSNIPDLSIYDPYPYVQAYRLWGRFSGTYEDIEQEELGRYRSFFYYSVMEAAPITARHLIYTDGWYMRKAVGTLQNPAFLDSYRTLESLPELTLIQNDPCDHLLLMANNATHSPCLLHLPDYTPSQEEDDSLAVVKNYEINGIPMNMEVPLAQEHYHVNMASLLMLGNWFDHLREAGVYDNTRIIIVADHGYSLGQFENLVMNEELDVQGYNPLMLVKDFNSHGFQTDNCFMTTGDIPSLAMEGLITDPVNPFTGNRIDMSGKEQPVYITLSDKLSLDQNTGNLLNTKDRPWYTVSDNIFDKANWQRVSE